MGRIYELTEPPPDLAVRLGPGGERIARLLTGVCRARPGAGPVPPGTEPVDLTRAVAEMDRVAGAWLAGLGDHAERARTRLAADGRTDDLDTALHLAMLLATYRLGRVDDCGLDGADARAVSGALLWLVSGAVTTALAGDDGFHREAGLIAEGWWPVGPVDGRFLIAPYPALRPPDGAAEAGRVP